MNKEIKEMEKILKSNKKISKINKELGKVKTKEIESLSFDTMRTKKKQIIKDLIEPAYEKDVKDNLQWRYTWRKISGISEGLAQIFTAFGTILAFASGTFQIEWLSFSAGCCLIISLVLNRFSRYSSGESKERTVALNIILKHLGLKNVPMIIPDNATEVNANMGNVASSVDNLV